MKKIIISALMGTVFAINAYSASFTTYIYPGTFTNILAFGPNISSVFVKGITIVSPSAGATSLAFIDTPTNSFTYTNAAYSTRGSYATNYISTWTNFYGSTQGWTNIALVDYSNNVPAGTNSYPIRFAASVATNTTTTFTGINYYFDQGMWATNSGTGVSAAAVTITY